MAKISKQAQAKFDQGYRKKPNCCGNCVNYESEMVEKEYKGTFSNSKWMEEKNMKCLLGGFAVTKSSICDKHDLKRG